MKKILFVIQGLALIALLPASIILQLNHPSPVAPATPASQQNVSFRYEAASEPATLKNAFSAGTGEQL